jgi:hypothetical protein
MSSGTQGLVDIEYDEQGIPLPVVVHTPEEIEEIAETIRYFDEDAAVELDGEPADAAEYGELEETDEYGELEETDADQDAVEVDYDGDDEGEDADPDLIPDTPGDNWRLFLACRSSVGSRQRLPRTQTAVQSTTSAEH